MDLLIHFEKLNEASLLLKYCSEETKKKISKKTLNVINNYLFIESNTTDSEDNYNQEKKLLKTLTLINPKEKTWLSQEYKAITQADDHSNSPKRTERFEEILNIQFGEIKGKLTSINMQSPLSLRQEFIRELQQSFNKKLHGQHEAKEAIINVIGQIISELNLKRFTQELKPSLHLKININTQFKLPYKVSKSDSSKTLSKYQQHQDSTHSNDTVGLINGLYATTDKRGGILPIQVITSPYLEKDIVTGKCGETMMESITVARTLNFLLNSPKNNNQTTEYIHLHVPDMGTQKDGPSAGTAITIAILSALRNQTIKHDIAITGEIDIHGNILPVGGILEKLTGARDTGINHVILPNKNQFELEKALLKDPQLSQELTITLVNRIEDVVPFVFIQQFRSPQLICRK